MTNRENLEISELKIQKAMEQLGRCGVCGKPLPASPVPQLAHKIGQGYVKIYGKRIIHHPLNMVLVCGLECNGKVLLNNKPVEKSELLEEIKYALEKEC